MTGTPTPHKTPPTPRIGDLTNQPIKMSALTEIAKLQEQIEGLKAQAATELSKKISAQKDAVKKEQDALETLTKEYEELTGKTLTGESVAERDARLAEEANPTTKGKGKGKRVKLTGDETEALDKKIIGLLKGSKGVKMAEILSACTTDKINDTHVKTRLKEINGIIKVGKLTKMTYRIA